MTRRPFHSSRRARWSDPGFGDMIVEAFNEAKPQRRRPVLDFFEGDDGAGTWTVREHSKWRPIARFAGTALAWAALVFFAFVLWLHH
jgi:hypothetical protein